MNDWLILGAGLVALYFGAEWLVKGGAGLALRLGLTPLVIGLTVVAFGTSSPELVVSVQASLSGNGAISIGNVVGSNICNIALILGLCALICPLRAEVQVVRREVPVMIGASVLAIAVLADGRLGRWEGAVLFAGLIGYTVFTLREARRGGAEPDEAFLPRTGKGSAWWVSAALVIVGLGVLVLGSHWFVSGAVSLARYWGLSDVTIGLTVVAVGTSLPELATSLLGALRKQADIAIGNVVGSNIFNVLGILGVAALLQPIEAPSLNWIDLGVMLAVSISLLPIVRTGHQVSRLEGAGLLAIYVGYTLWLLQSSGG